MTPDLPFAAPQRALVRVPRPAEPPPRKVFVATQKDDAPGGPFTDEQFHSMLECEEPDNEAEALALLRYLERRIGNVKAFLRSGGKQPVNLNSPRAVEVAQGVYRLEILADDELEFDDESFSAADPAAPVPAEVTE